jgi:hypothetical protein
MDFSSYPEYRKRNFRSLIVELGRVVDVSVLPELRSALVGYEQFLDLASVEKREEKTIAQGGGSRQALMKASGILHRRIMKPRWRSAM